MQIGEEISFYSEYYCYNYTSTKRALHAHSTTYHYLVPLILPPYYIGDINATTNTNYKNMSSVLLLFCFNPGCSFV